MLETEDFSFKFRKLFSNKCCADETDFSDFNETLKVVKTECVIETKKNRKNYNGSEDTIDGDGELYNMFSCDRIKRWKTFVTCAIECVAQKVGVVINTICQPFNLHSTYFLFY